MINLKVCVEGSGGDTVGGIFQALTSKD